MPGKSKHWRDQRERGSGFWQMRFVLWSYRALGPKGLRVFLFQIVFCFFAFAPRLRRVSRDFLRRAAAFHGKPAPRPLDNLRYVVSFAYSMIEKIAAWSNDLDLTRINFHDDAVGELIDGLEAGRGAIIICSHVGNMELLRALATNNKTRVSRPFGVTSIVDFAGTARFNRLIAEIDPGSTLRLVSAADIGVDTILDLQRRLAEGEVLAIAGDRTAATNRDKVEIVPFLGADAAFPQGAFVLASLLEAPVYFMFGVRVEDMNPTSRYDLVVARARTELSGTRKERREKIKLMIEEYARHLERLCGEHPLQWYNFYDFWDIPNAKRS